jgi:hypothetical protein
MNSSLAPAAPRDRISLITTCPIGQPPPPPELLLDDDALVDADDEDAAEDTDEEDAAEEDAADDALVDAADEETALVDGPAEEELTTPDEEVADVDASDDEASDDEASDDDDAAVVSLEVALVVADATDAPPIPLTGLPLLEETCPTGPSSPPAPPLGPGAESPLAPTAQAPITPDAISNNISGTKKRARVESITTTTKLPASGTPFLADRSRRGNGTNRCGHCVVCVSPAGQ